MTKIKICGLRREEDIQAVNCYEPDYIGFVFAPSKRQVTIEEAEKLSKALKSSICPVGVFVNEDMEKILEIVSRNIIRVVQFHGQETISQMNELKKRLEGKQVPVIKAISVTGEDFLEEVKRWQDSDVDYLLLDAGKGGTGQQFNHQLLEEILPLEKPWFMAGGMKEDLIPDIIEKFHPYGVDVSSGVETDGWKDKNKIEHIIRRVHNEQR